MTTQSTPLAELRKLQGTIEAPGSADNPTILAWAHEIGVIFPDMASYCANYTHDSIAWCGLTQAIAHARCGIRPPFVAGDDVHCFLWADGWSPWGTALATPVAGCVLVFKWPSGEHHVTMYLRTEGDNYVCLGGNQSDQVKESSYPASQCVAIRAAPATTLAATHNAAPVANPGRQTGITATVFGGSSDQNTSAYDGHAISDTEMGCALPYRFPRPIPAVRVYAGGKSIDCAVVDVGPWNTNDPYWQTGARPEAESGTDHTGRKTNHAGIDLTPAAARALGIDGKGTVDWQFITSENVTMTDNGQTRQTAAPAPQMPTVFNPQPSTANQFGTFLDAMLRRQMDSALQDIQAHPEHLLQLMAGQAVIGIVPLNPASAAPAPQPAVPIPPVASDPGTFNLSLPNLTAGGGILGFALNGILQALGTVNTGSATSQAINTVATTLLAGGGLGHLSNIATAIAPLGQTLLKALPSILAALPK